ncbi:phytoene desaturase family protein [Cohnella zeiphila]|uniref:NAD(P)/FAD-dependent oxidoreductase n=1 Tax=Cohnella zeiphila TaxID=2761120 RepID=A0A7X0SNC3_9BACL|nr:FAD-dependent oxidoreductase [Cohnella zeiphila]MBB6733160.1 NAD(P)/FAD-dependent oxidoreductase [Cohnella zeiphila]
MQAYETIVIGGGIAGLVAAADLARAGRRVMLLERGERLGGRGTTARKDGALFNLGGHALYLGGEAYSILGELGVKPAGSKPLTDGSAVWRGGLMPLPDNAFRLMSSKLMTLSGKMEFGSLMMKLGRIDPASLAHLSVRDWAERQLRDPMVRHLFYALARTGTYSMEIDSQQAGAVVRQVQRSLKNGVLYLDGGWQTIVDSLRDAAVRAGADIRCRAGAAEIVSEDGRVRGVRLASGELLNARQVISALPPAETCGLVPNGEDTALGFWKRQARPVRVASLDLVMRRLPVPDRHFAIALDQPLFFSNHSRVAKLSDNGSMVIHVTKYHGAEGSDPKRDERMLEDLTTLMQPNWQRELIAKRFLPNLTVVHDQIRVGRSGPLPGPSVPEIPGLYVAGDWASHGEMLVDAAAASARRASRAALAELAGTAANAVGADANDRLLKV